MTDAPPSTDPFAAPAHVFAPPALVTAQVLGGGLFPVHRIYCVGRNYAAHAQEMGHSGREPPFFFLKPADALLPVAAGQTGQLKYPGLTCDLQHEVELVVAIGTGGSEIAVADAAGHIWGHAVGLDMTRRDLQGQMKALGRPWCIGKSFEQSAPIGPLVPLAQTGDLRYAAITLSVNGAQRQRGALSDLIWTTSEIIAALSRAWTLQAGDLVYTGTPAGVAAVVRGDVMEGRIDGLPPLRVAVV